MAERGAQQATARRLRVWGRTYWAQDAELLFAWHELGSYPNLLRVEEDLRRSMGLTGDQLDDLLFPTNCSEWISVLAREQHRQHDDSVADLHEREQRIAMTFTLAYLRDGGDGRKVAGRCLIQPRTAASVLRPGLRRDQ